MVPLLVEDASDTPPAKPHSTARFWPLADRHSDLNEGDPAVVVHARTPASVTMP